MHVPKPEGFLRLDESSPPLYQRNAILGRRMPREGSRPYPLAQSFKPSSAGFEFGLSSSAFSNHFTAFEHSFR